jgi:hypothetical protein
MCTSFNPRLIKVCTDDKRTKREGVNLPSALRQPFVGLSIFAAIGIICADFFPLHGFVASIAAIVLIAALVLLRWPHLTSTYALVCAGFFLLHTFQITDTPGLRLTKRL